MIPYRALISAVGQRLLLLAWMTVLVSATTAPALTMSPIAFDSTATGLLEMNTAIAYVASSRLQNEIRLINPDGTGERPLYQIPPETHRFDRIGRLSWRPDASEIAFDSGHDWQRSMKVRDLYSVSLNDNRLRRLTRPPAPADYTTYPTGTVTYLLDSFASGEVQLYTEGATEPLSFFARLGFNYQITQTLADLGPNIQQGIRLWDPDSLSPPCNFSEEGVVDPVAGQVTDFIRIRFGVTDDFACPKVTSPAWTHDGNNIVYLYAEASTTFQDENNIWGISDNAAPLSDGVRLLDYGQYVGDGRIYQVAPGRSPETANLLLFTVVDSIYTFMYISPADDAANRQRINPGVCPVLFCTIGGVAWLPDGSGFLFTRFESGGIGNPVNSVIYRYDLTTQQFSEIYRMPDTVIGRLDVSPSGQSIVFERSNGYNDELTNFWLRPLLLCPCEVWTVGIDGLNEQLLVADGRSPVWSPTALPAP